MKIWKLDFPSTVMSSVNYKHARTTNQRMSSSRTGSLVQARPCWMDAIIYLMPIWCAGHSLTHQRWKNASPWRHKCFVTKRIYWQAKFKALDASLLVLIFPFLCCVFLATTVVCHTSGNTLTGRRANAHRADGLFATDLGCWQEIE